MDVGFITTLFAGVPVDWIVLGVIVIVFTVDTLRSGMGRVAAFSVALPIALLFYSLLEKTILIREVGTIFASPLAQSIAFLVIIALCFFLVRRMGLDYMESGAGEPVQSLIAGVAIAVVGIVVYLHVPAFESYTQISDNIRDLFAEQYQLWWLLGAYLGLAFARG